MYIRSYLLAMESRVSQNRKGWSRVIVINSVFGLLRFQIFTVLDTVVYVRQDQRDAIFVSYVEWNKAHHVIIFDLIQKNG